MSRGDVLKLMGGVDGDGDGAGLEENRTLRSGREAETV